MNLAIEARGLGKDYGAQTAVEALDLEVARGELFGFLGPNGAGKSTTIRMLTTMLSPSRGTARVAGHDVAREPLAVRRRTGLVFQETTLDVDLTALENLRFVARLYGLSRADTRTRVDEALDLFDLTSRRGDIVRSFSGGMRRALDLARGVLHRPEVLFLDEPTLGLDPGSRRRVWDFLGRLQAAGTTLFLTTHQLEEADPCARVAIVDGGRIVACGAPAELKRALGGESVEVEALAPRPTLGAEIRTLTGMEPQERKGKLTLSATDPEAVVVSLLPLISAGVRVSVRPPSLEDVFVSVTGGGR